MQQMTAEEVISRIVAAATPQDLFNGSHEAPTDARQARRGYRAMVAAIHPDVARANGVALGDAQAATAKLNDLYEQWRTGGARPAATATPHVVGDRGTYLLRTRLHQAPLLSTYSTDRTELRVAISRSGDLAAAQLLEAARTLTGAGLAAFGPAIVDTGVVDGRAWTAYRVPEGMHTLRAVRAAYPAGLDGRDWAWMARRILIALDAAERLRGDVGLDTVLIHPDSHGVVLTGWGGAPIGPRPGAAHDALDGPELAELFDTMLAAREISQRRFARAAQALPPNRWLAEYDLLLRRLYGERRYRPFSLPRTA